MAAVVLVVRLKGAKMVLKAMLPASLGHSQATSSPIPWKKEDHKFHSQTNSLMTMSRSVASNRVIKDRLYRIRRKFGTSSRSLGDLVAVTCHSSLLVGKR